MANRPAKSRAKGSGSKDSVKVGFLGGLGDIGRNCAFVESGGRIVLIDCGIMFPEADMPGVDVVLPDFTYLLDKLDQIDGVLLTHGHEDHTGALSHLLRLVDTKIYGSALSLGLARSRIEEARLLRHCELIAVADGERRKVGPFEVEFIPTTHSVPGAFALAIRTPQGVIIHSGDFKIDLNPVDGRRTDLARIGQIAATEGVRLLLSDSTNAEQPGFTASESSVGPTIEKIFRANPQRRIVVTCFASHLHRVQQVIDAAVITGRKVATIGRSMGKNIELGLELGLLRVPEGTLVELERIGDYQKGQVCVISTGSQGEPLSALTLMARGSNRRFALEAGDVVMLSSSPIPGNEWSVGRVIDDLYRLGTHVIHSGNEVVHVSGHASQGELQTLIALCQPEFFVPVHGEFRHLLHHAELAERTGLDRDHVVLCEDGDVVALSASGIALAAGVPAAHIFVDGNATNLGPEVIKDRTVLADEGVVVVAAAVDLEARTLVGRPVVLAKGWLHGDQMDQLLAAGAAAVERDLLSTLGDRAAGLDALSRSARKGLGRIIGEKTRRRPMVIPVIVDAQARASNKSTKSKRSSG